MTPHAEPNPPNEFTEYGVGIGMGMREASEAIVKVFGGIAKGMGYEPPPPPRWDQTAWWWLLDHTAQIVLVGAVFWLLAGITLFAETLAHP